MLTVQGVVDRVGPTLLRAVLIAPTPRQVNDVVIAEPGRRGQLAAGDLVLGAAVGTGRDAVELIRHAGERGAAAVLLKPPASAQATVVAAGRSAGTSLVEVRSGTGWAQLVWLLRTVLDADAETDPKDIGPSGLTDLFRLADAVAAVVDAPVTIEDANSRVLAYSARQDRTDPARVSTIMGRRVPDDVLARFRSRGVFRDLSRGGNPIYVAAQPDGTLPRLIVPIRMGGELLGSMWAVVADRVPDARAAAFADAGQVVALHLLRRRARVDAQRQHSAE
ncbi:MAG TPA: PucR family transcriptional regulator, partial [Pseudonocardiaceae bacterium]